MTNTDNSYQGLLKDTFLRRPCVVPSHQHGFSPHHPHSQPQLDHHGPMSYGLGGHSTSHSPSMNSYDSYPDHRSTIDNRTRPPEVFGSSSVQYDGNDPPVSYQNAVSSTYPVSSDGSFSQFPGLHPDCSSPIAYSNSAGVRSPRWPSFDSTIEQQNQQNNFIGKESYSSQPGQSNHYSDPNYQSRNARASEESGFEQWGSFQNPTPFWRDFGTPAFPADKTGSQYVNSSKDANFTAIPATYGPCTDNSILFGTQSFSDTTLAGISPDLFPPHSFAATSSSINPQTDLDEPAGINLTNDSNHLATYGTEFDDIEFFRSPTVYEIDIVGSGNTSSEKSSSPLSDDIAPVGGSPDYTNPSAQPILIQNFSVRAGRRRRLPSPRKSKTPSTPGSPETINSPASSDGFSRSGQVVIQCTECDQEFPQRYLFNKHYKTHTLPVRCLEPGCPKRFAVKRDMTRHVTDRHSKEWADKAHPCAVENCKRGASKPFKRRDNMLRHLHGVHNNLPEEELERLSSLARVA